MIISVNKLRDFIKTNKDDLELEAYLQALEVGIRKHTNNNFIKKGVYFSSSTSPIMCPFPEWLKTGDTLQVSNSPINNGVYTIKTIEGPILTLNEPIFEEANVLFTKVEYPADIVMGVIEILRWKLQNEDLNYNPDAEKPVQSESISKHSVTYAKDNTEEDIDERFGVPKKYTTFLRRYQKARF